MGHGGNVIAELTTDHREVEAFFAQIESLPAGDKRRRELADELVDRARDLLTGRGRN